ncbi:flagellar basal body-associated protein FliL [Halomonas sp. MCCC 1A17488]|uniref:Flagellar protein FliL n=1 Tax=Billgrantia sulfidoxydans TaxID=2733484 RepID=A0ABX7W8R9_9GAMM|nr:MULTISPECIES: flagellar basal body-associated protein FliL [Halomonas]MCE8014794.1 flagellar basal body-associated protein FliL [Halomonas sp. MCCC 1A17488]MCG3238127.1 flagellar basal body-associated protein FliL [Halomonas sp. MCCC 1A17488]QPP48104.1 flagellar basal body-associated protein FliL [Halomonas sp. SS10-MC5]QTP55393.1 flagellar basal body-associated protein FliL [Halomonas sulfidoxydans]
MAKSTGGSSKLLWLMILLVLLSTAAAGAAIYMVMNDRNEGDASLQTQQIERQAPIFVKIDPFTVNLADDNFGSRLLYTGISLKVGADETREILIEHMPQVRSRLLMLFSGKQASELTTPDGKRRLSEEVIAVLSEPLTEPQPSLEIQDVLFTEFIVQ